MVRTIATAYREAYGGLSREVWWLSLALLINRSGSMVLAFLTLYLTTKLGFTIVQAGAIFSVYGIGSIAGSYASGKLIRHVGAVRLQIVALMISCPCFMIVPLFESWLSVACAIFWMSFFSESVRPANNVAIMQFTAPELHTRAFGLQRMALNLGLSIGPAVGGVIAEYQFDWLFYVDGLTTLVGAAALWAYFGIKRYPRVRGKSQQNTEVDGLGSPIGDPAFLIFLGLMLGVALIFFQFHATYPKYLEDHYQMSKSGIGFLYAVNTLVIVAVEMLLVNFVSRFRLLATVGWGCFCACFGFAILPLSTAVGFALVSMLIITFGEMLMFPLATGFVAQRSRGKDAGLYMSWYAMTYSVTSVVAPLAGTAIYQWRPDAIWWCAGVMGVLVLVGFYRLGHFLQRSVVAEPTG